MIFLWIVLYMSFYEANKDDHCYKLALQQFFCFDGAHNTRAYLKLISSIP